MSLVKICSEEGCFNVKSIGAEGKAVSMDKFEEIQQLHGGPKDVNDSSSDKENDEDKDSE